jgi:cytochrome P450
METESGGPELAGNAAHRPKVDFDILDPALANAIWERITDLRVHCPVGWSDQHGGFWLLNRHDEVWTAAQNWRRFSSADGAAPVQFDLEVFRMIPLETDPPFHREVRKVLNPLFTPEALKRSEPLIEGIIRELLDRCIELSPCDFVRHFTMALPSQVFFRTFLYGERPEDVDWVIGIIDELFFRPESAAENIPELGAWCSEMMESRRREGRRDDLVGTIAHAGLEGEVTLDDRQRLETMLLVVIAGMETTASALGNVTRQLAMDSSLRLQLRGQPPTQIDRAVDEFLRFEAPVPAAARTLTDDTELRGCPMGKGERVILNWAAANRDPVTFPDPDVLDFDRDNLSKQVAFGAGIHHCLGAHLARRELRLAIGAMCDLSTFELLIPGEDVQYRPGPARGPVELPVRCER